VEHLRQFAILWDCLQEIHLLEDVEDDIIWNITANGQYSAKSAYDVQYLGSTFSIMHKTVWKAWATPKEKLFSWLLLQNRVWTT
jgi:hypothetical protein